MGVVEFASRAEAQDAVRVLDETELDGRQISVREDRDPPSAGGGDRDRERGDVRAELRGPRGGDVQTCHNCGGLGHLSRDCPSEPGIGGGGAGGRAPRARALPPLRSEREPPARGPVMSGACNKCGKEGHWARECPSAGGGGGRGGGGRGGGRGGRPQVDGAALDADMDACAFAAVGAAPILTSPPRLCRQVRRGSAGQGLACF